MPVDKMGTDGTRLRRGQLVAAGLLIILSLVAKVKAGPFELAGGPTLVGLAAVVLLWPLLRQLSLRGGSTEFMGLKFQINSLEQRSEQEFGLRISELRADVERLRAVLDVVAGPTAETAVRQEVSKELERVFWEAVEAYNAHGKKDEWHERVEADKRLTAAAAVGTFPVAFLEAALQQHPLNRGVAMAAAVALGTRAPGEALESARLLSSLLGSRSERARYRAARAIGRLAARADLKDGEYRLFWHSLHTALDQERSDTVWQAMKSAEEALRMTPYFASSAADAADEPSRQ
jgi:hypothetical protein